MHTTQKHKVIIISDSGLLQRHFDYYYLDNLNEAFDFEYWNCSRLILSEEHQIKSQIKRPYDVTINSYWQFFRYLQKLPNDTLIVYFALKGSNIFNFILHSFFKHLIQIRVSMIIPNSLDKKQEIKPETTMQVAESVEKHNILKDFFFKSDVIRIGMRMLFHPTKAKKIFLSHINNYIWHEISCVPGSKHHINASNFEKYMKSKDLVADRRFIVYVDQYFPYHKELQFEMTAREFENLAQSHFTKLNIYFSKIENEYKCPVVIAAHPLSQYVSNPFNGREIQYGTTDMLISQSEGVIMHNSGSISYAILNNKPVVLIHDSEYRQCFYYKGVVNLHKKYNIDMVDIDYNDIPLVIKPLPQNCRKNFIEEYCGDVNEKDFVYNDVLLIQCLNDIYVEINGDCQ